MSNFSKFLNGIYELRNSFIKNRNDFLCDFFKAAGREEPIYLSEYTLKSICNGYRELTDELTSQFPKEPDRDGETKYLQEALNKNRIMDFFNEFGIEDNEKQNYQLLCEAIARQFENFMRYGDIVTTTVKSLYIFLLDESLPRNINNNEDALFAAKTCLYNAIQSFSKYEKNESLIDSRGSLEDVFSNIYSSFKGFEKRCNHEGLTIYRELRKELLIDRSEISNYLKMVSEPGSLPLPMERSVNVTVYDNEHFGDMVIHYHLKQDGIFDEKKLIYSLEKSGKIGNSNKVYFTEEYTCHLIDSSDNFIPDLFYSLSSLVFFWIQIEKRIGGSERINQINKKIETGLLLCQKTGLCYYYDGTYYPKDKRIIYDCMNEQLIHTKEGLTMLPEDMPLAVDEIPVIKGGDFKDRFMRYVSRILGYAEEHNNAIPTECIITLDNDSCFWFAFPSPSVSTRSRKIRKIEKIAKDLGGQWFFWSSMNKGSEIEQNDRRYLDSMTKEEYDNSDFLCIYGFDKNGIFSYCIKKEDIPNRDINIKITNDPFMVFLDVIYFTIIGKRHD